MFAILMIPAMILSQTIPQSDDCSQGNSACLDAYSQSVRQSCYTASTTEETIADIFKRLDCTCSIKNTFKDW